MEVGQIKYKNKENCKVKRVLPARNSVNDTNNITGYHKRLLSWN